MEKLKSVVKENLFFIIFYIIVIGYSIYRMYSPAIWNDEIYTYTFFASRGVFYSMTHYASNNHLLFTVLSCFLRWFLPYIALRGVSFISSVLSVLFLYLLLKKIYSNFLATLGCMVFCWSWLTNFFALQGRGYALATLFLILALWSGYEIVYREANSVPGVKQEESFTRYHMIFMLSLFCGMYTIISSGFWALPVSLSLGIAVLFTGRYKRLKKLILAAVIALILFVLAYFLMISSIGALAIRFAGGSISHLDALKTLILHPIQSFKQGMQGIMDLGFFQHFKLEGEAMLRMVWIMCASIIFSFTRISVGDKSVIVLLTLSAVTLIFVLYLFFFNKKEGNRTTDKVFTGLVVAVGIPIAVLLFWIQSMETFTRVFSYMGVYMAFLFVFYIDLIAGVVRRFSIRDANESELQATRFADEAPTAQRKKRTAGITHRQFFAVQLACFLALFVFFISQMFDPYWDCEYDENEQWAIDAIENIDWEGIQTYGSNDVYANYQTNFWRNYVAKEEVIYDVDNPDVIIISPKPFDGIWPFNITAEENARLERSLKGRILIYDNGWYEVYK